MAAPTFDPVNVPNRQDPTAKKIDNVQVIGADGVAKDRQVVVTGDPSDASAIAATLARQPSLTEYGTVVRVAGGVAIVPADVFTEMLRELRAIRLGMEEFTRRPLGLEVGVIDDDASKH